MLTYSKAEQNQKVSAVDIERAIVFIQNSVQFQLERLQLFVDSALLAVEQVQDKRIEMQENPKQEVNIYEVFFNMVLMYCWQVKLVEPLINQATKGIVNHLLKTRAVYNSLPKSDYGAQIIGMAKQEVNSKHIIDQIIKDHVVNQKRFTSNDFAMFSSDVINFVSKAPDSVFNAGKKGKDIYKKLSQKSTPLTFGDTPSVSVLSSAQSYMRNHRLTLMAQQTEIIALLRIIQLEKAPITKKDLNQFLSLFTWDEIEDYEGLREKYKLVFEGVIWSQLFHWKYYKYYVDQDKLNGVPPKLLDYLHERFRPILIEDPRIGPYDKQVKSIKNKKLKLFFDDLIQIKMNQLEIDKVFIVKDKKE